MPPSQEMRRAVRALCIRFNSGGCTLLSRVIIFAHLRRCPSEGSLPCNERLRVRLPTAAPLTPVLVRAILSHGTPVDVLRAPTLKEQVMQNIHVKRLNSPYIQGSIEPEDRSWIVVIEKNGEAVFYRRAEAKLVHGKRCHVYVDAELPTRGSACAEDTDGCGGFEIAEPPKPRDPRDPETGGKLGPLDFEVRQIPEEQPDGSLVTEGWWATLSSRSVAAYGATEHDAIRALLNYVAQLCTAGCMDHTGAPVAGHNRRRYEAVWPLPEGEGALLAGTMASDAPCDCDGCRDGGPHTGLWATTEKALT